MKLAIKKLGYSRSPWRLVDLDDLDNHSQPREISVSAVSDHPTLGMTVFAEPIMGNTQKECVDQVLTLLGKLIELHESQKVNIPAN